MFPFRNWIARILVTLVVLVVAAGAAWWFFIREDNAAQKEAAPVTEEVRQAASATASSASSTPSPGATAAPGSTSTFKGKSYKIIEGQSTAWYLAGEKLASLPLPSTAKGVTNDVTGEFHLADGGLDPSKPTTFTVGLKSLKSDQGQRDRRVQDALETSKFPTATFTAKSLTGLPADFGATHVVMQLTGTFELHGVKQEVTWELKAKRDGDILSGLATLKLKYSDFNITPPNIAGFVSVEDNLTLQVQLFAAAN